MLLFLLIYGVFQWAYQSLRTSSWDDWFIHQLTVRPAAWLVDFASPSEGVQASGHKLVWPGGGIALRAGCDGFEVIGLFISAVLVGDVGWRRGLLVLIGGCLAIWGLNQLRIAALYAAVRYDPSWFDSVHTGWGPLIMIGAVASIYYWLMLRPRVPVSA